MVTLLSSSAAVTLQGWRLKPVEEEVAASTGLDRLFVVHDVAGVSAHFDIPAGATNIRWKKFGYKGAAYAEDVDPSLINTQGGVSVLSQVEGDMGYAIEYGADTYYFWVVNWSTHPFSITSLSVSPEEDCYTTTLLFDGSAESIFYYTINARSVELNRDINLSWYTLTPMEGKAEFEQKAMDKSFASLHSAISIDAPLCDTRFTLSGDKYLRAWDRELTVSTSTIAATAVATVTTANQQSRDNDNEIKVESTLGGSAPVTIDFDGAISDAAVYHEWQMSRDNDFYDIFYRNTSLNFTYTFNEMGTIYVRLLAANASGTCETQGDPYQVYVGESQLLCPNAFSPGSTPGVNDEWRVSYKSIISFECYIFDRWGTKMYEFHDPSGGWDGKYHGKVVPAGVYYYVINARGADGKNYKLSGDINILKSNR